MPKMLHKALNPKQVTTLGPGTHSDGGGLALRVDDRGNRRWIWRGTVSGKAAVRGLGAYPAVSLSEARKAAVSMAEEARTLAKTPTRPPTPTFGEMAREYLTANRPTWTNAKHAAQWRNTLARYVEPVIGTRPVDEITTADVLAVLTPIWLEKHETASRVRQRMEAVFYWAIAHEHRDRANPATKAILVGLPKFKQVQEHYRALPYAEVPAALHRVGLSTAYPATKLAFKFLVLTAVRSGEVRGADWSEIDWEQRLWTVQTKRMKAKREHRVPLSEQAMSVLRDAWTLGSGEGLIFPAKEGGKMSDMVFIALVRRLKFDCVPHGFRSSFRDWCAETGVGRDPAEASLAHSLGENTTENAYFRTRLLEMRRGLMQDWADYCAG